MFTYCDVGDEHRAFLTIKAGQNRTWGFKDKINPSKNIGCTVRYSYSVLSYPKYEVHMISHNSAQFDLLRTKEVHRPHKFATFCALYIKRDGIYRRDPRNMKDIFRIQWETSIA